MKTKKIKSYYAGILILGMLIQSTPMTFLQAEETPSEQSVSAEESQPQESKVEENSEELSSASEDNEEAGGFSEQESANTEEDIVLESEKIEEEETIEISAISSLDSSPKDSQDAAGAEETMPIEETTPPEESNNESNSQTETSDASSEISESYGPSGIISTQPVPDETIPVVPNVNASGPDAPQQALEIFIEPEETVEVQSNPDADTPLVPTIISGEAIAMANILNLVNTNFVNSQGSIVFINSFDPADGAVDLRDYFNNNGQCGASPCMAGSGITVSNSDDAVIDNLILVNATTGDNLIESTNGGIIDSGNAYAGLNLINIANTNIINSHYLIAAINAFKGITGDIVLPSMRNFYSTLFSMYGADTMKIKNNAEVENILDINTDSGNNTLNQEGTILGGDAKSSVNIFNQLNKTMQENSSISFVMNVTGNWNGEVFGLPSHLTWVRGEQNKIFIFNKEALRENLGGSMGATIDNNSTATILNDLRVNAISGRNNIDSIEGGGTSLISTGDAYAGVNVANIANTTIVGQNWILAIINVFGDFDGNIAFGRPDLWIGVQADIPEKTENDSILTYKISIINNGDSDATQIKVVEDYDQEHLEILDSSLSFTDEDGNMTWNIGSLAPGKGTEISYSAKIVNTVEDTAITNIIKVLSREKDSNKEDNTDTLSFHTYKTPDKNGSNNENLANPNQPSELPQREIKNVFPTLEEMRLTVKRETETTTLSSAPFATTQKLIITNKSETDIPSVILYDTLKDPEGKVVSEYNYDLGKVYKNEEISIEYDISFNAEALGGKYTLTTRIPGTDAKEPNGSIVLIKTIVSEMDVEGSVLGASTENLTKNDSFSLLDKLSVLGVNTTNASGPESPLTDIYPDKKIDYLFLIVLLGTIIGCSLSTYLNHSRKNSLS